MKNLRRILIWVTISLTIQCGAFFYLDKFFFTTETNFKSVKIENNKANVKNDIKIKIPEGSKHFNVSYNGKYAAYYEGSNLKVINTTTDELVSIPSEEGVTISFYKWLPDRDRMIIAEKKTTKQGESIKFASFDVKRGEKTEIRDNHDNAVYINLPDKKSEVEDISLSTLTNVIYVKLSHAGNRNSIYRINIMGNMDKVKLNGYIVGNMLTLNREDNFIYEDITLKDPVIRNTNSSSIIKIKNVPRIALLTVDGEDRIYVGELDGTKIKKIFFGKMNESTDKWQTYTLPQAVESNDIYISNEGKIYLNNNLTGVITEAATSKQTVYTGKFYEMYLGGVAAIDNNILVKKSFE